VRVPGQPIIEFENVSILLGGRQILDRETFTVGRGELFVVIGYSGTGKSVTLQNLTGLLTPDEGSIKVAGEQVVGMDEDELRQMRRRFGYLFQHGALIKWLTVAENVDLPLREHTSYSKRRRRETVLEKLKLVNMDQDGDKYPSEISGGMQKRAALARAIALDPEIILFDEPTSGLDPVIGHQIDSLIKTINKDLGITCVVVTHDMESAYYMADRIAFFYKGRMDYIGTPEEVQNTTDEELRHFITGGREGSLSVRTQTAIFQSKPITGDSARMQAVQGDGSSTGQALLYAEGYDPNAPDLNSPDYLLRQPPKAPKRKQTSIAHMSAVDEEEARARRAELEALILSDEELEALDLYIDQMELPSPPPPLFKKSLMGSMSGSGQSKPSGPPPKPPRPPKPPNPPGVRADASEAAAVKSDALKDEASKPDAASEVQSEAPGPSATDSSPATAADAQAEESSPAPEANAPQAEHAAEADELTPAQPARSGDAEETIRVEPGTYTPDAADASDPIDPNSNNEERHAS